MTNVNQSETNGITLLPCPFCGSEAEIHQTIERWIATCSSDQNELDGFTHTAQAYGATKAEAIEAWNTRAERTCRNTQSDFDFMCSECGKCVDNGRIIGFNYCPNCGRKVVDQ